MNRRYLADIYLSIYLSKLQIEMNKLEKAEIDR